MLHSCVLVILMPFTLIHNTMAITAYFDCDNQNVSFMDILKLVTVTDGTNTMINVNVVAGSSAQLQNFTAVLAQQDFTPAFTIGTVYQVFLNGSLQPLGVYTKVGNTIHFAVPMAGGESVTIITF